MAQGQFSDALPVGTDIAGYEITRVLGQGGFGITYLARNPVTEEWVAVKEFFPRGHASRSGTNVQVHSDIDPQVYEGVLRRFETEARKLIRVFDHPNIVHGKNFVRAHGSAFLVLEYVDGITISEWLANRPARPTEAEIRPLIEPILDAVDYIHELGGMHRDISPRNVMICADNGRVRPVLIDFGATAEGLDLVRDSSTVVMANEAYAPPEQLYPGMQAQGRYTDIFALAGMLYFIVAGRPPPRAMQRMVALAGKTDDPLSDLHAALGERVGDYSQQFLAGIEAGLRLSAEDRPQSVAAFREALGWTDEWEDADPGQWLLDEIRPDGTSVFERPHGFSHASGPGRAGSRALGSGRAGSRASSPRRPASGSAAKQRSGARPLSTPTPTPLPALAPRPEPASSRGRQGRRLLIGTAAAAVVLVAGASAFGLIPARQAYCAVIGCPAPVPPVDPDLAEMQRLLGPPRAAPAELVAFAERMRAKGKACFALQAGQAAADGGEVQAMNLVAHLFSPDSAVEDRCGNVNVAETARYLRKAAMVDGSAGQDRLAAFCRRIPDFRGTAPEAFVALAMAECRT